MEPWYTSDLSLLWQLPVRRPTLTLHLDVNNVLDQDYEVIVNYPMPGRNYALTLNVTI